MAANRLCNDDAYICACVTDITGIEEVKGGFAVTLSDTIFHPKGGGQPADRGTIAGLQVLDVREEGGEVYHTLPARPEETKDVKCRLDWDFRYDLMQQHTGQHILSTVIENLFNNDTTIFRGEEAICQIDLEKPITPEEVVRAENLTNAIVKKNLAVRCFGVTREEIPAYTSRMRHPVYDHDVIRLVEIEDFDLIGCGGSHVKSTGEVGFVKVLYAKNVADQKGAKGAARLYFLCGDRAFADYTRLNSEAVELGGLLSCDRALVFQKTAELKSAYDRLSAKAAVMSERLLALEANALLATAEEHGAVKLVTAFMEGVDVKSLKATAEALTAENPVIALLAARDGETLAFVFAQQKGLTEHKVNLWLKELLDELSGRGGGNQVLAQGTLPYSDAAKAAFDKKAAEVGKIL
ncbi:MAG TPA: DHHA1 domain-containing protein [Terriglobales bacterium]|nr:DHHA1 domain-containing protein [Terriglobales bacterium]